MPTDKPRELRKLTLDRVDLVKSPANPDSRVLLFKEEDIEKMIKREDGKFVLYDAEGKKKLGTYDTKDDAMAAMRRAEHFGKAADPADYAYVPDPDKPSTWKLQIDTPEHIAGAVAALGPGGFRGNKVQIPAKDLAKVKAKVKAAWLRAHPDKKDQLPAVLKSSAIFGGMMTLDKSKLPEAVVKHLEELEVSNPEAATALAETLAAGQEAAAAPATPTAEIEMQKGEFAKLQKQLEDERTARLDSEKRIAKMEEDAKRTSFVALAKADLEPLGKADDLADILLSAESLLSEEVYKSLLQVLKGAAAQLATGELFKQRADVTGEPSDVEQKIEDLAKEAVKAGVAKTIEMGKLHVLSTNPELYAEYRAGRDA